MKPTRAINRHDWIVGFVVLTMYLIVLISGAILLLPDYWYLWLLIVFGGVFLLNGWHTRSYAYICANCTHTFEINYWTNFFAPHGVDREGGWTSLKCPSCGKRTHARIVHIITPSEDRA